MTCGPWVKALKDYSFTPGSHASSQTKQKRLPSCQQTQTPQLQLGGLLIEEKRSQPQSVVDDHSVILLASRVPPCDGGLARRSKEVSVLEPLGALQIHQACTSGRGGLTSRVPSLQEPLHHKLYEATAGVYGTMQYSFARYVHACEPLSIFSVGQTDMDHV